MLSQENIQKLHMNGIYRCDPVLSWLPSYKQDNPYWCQNWTFRVREYNGKYWMIDTYWSTGDDHPKELTDENFDKFELIFDLDDVERFNGEYSRWICYPKDDRWLVAIDSGGLGHAKYFIRKGSRPIKEKILELLNEELNSLQSMVYSKQRDIERVMNDEVDLRYV